MTCLIGCNWGIWRILLQSTKQYIEETLTDVNTRSGQQIDKHYVSREKIFQASHAPDSRKLVVYPRSIEKAQCVIRGGEKGGGGYVSGEYVERSWYDQFFSMVRRSTSSSGVDSQTNAAKKAANRGSKIRAISQAKQSSTSCCGQR